jgi:hypothetical protein
LLHYNGIQSRCRLPVFATSLLFPTAKLSLLS